MKTDKCPKCGSEVEVLGYSNQFWGGMDCRAIKAQPTPEQPKKYRVVKESICGLCSMPDRCNTDDIHFYHVYRSLANSKLHAVVCDGYECHVMAEVEEVEG
jgi:hypothetical protein